MIQCAVSAFELVAWRPPLLQQDFIQPENVAKNSRAVSMTGAAAALSSYSSPRRMGGTLVRLSSTIPPLEAPRDGRRRRTATSYSSRRVDFQSPSGNRSLKIYPTLRPFPSLIGDFDSRLWEPASGTPRCATGPLSREIPWATSSTRWLPIRAICRRGKKCKGSVFLMHLSPPEL